MSLTTMPTVIAPSFSVSSVVAKPCAMPASGNRIASSSELRADAVRCRAEVDALAVDDVAGDAEALVHDLAARGRALLRDEFRRSAAARRGRGEDVLRPSRRSRHRIAVKARLATAFRSALSLSPIGDRRSPIGAASRGVPSPDGDPLDACREHARSRAPRTGT
ncbi:MAG TPA: hypothetical protein VEL07_17480 [Planctomycetota bacterium]|nr:hypothetical protein [Planctomycetota bacterium]